MRIDVVTIFPGMFGPIFGESIIKRAQKKGVVKINVINLRDFSKDKHRKVDDKPFGGGPGMVMNVAPFYNVVNHLKAKGKGHTAKSKVILMGPRGKKLDQKLAKKLSKYGHLVILCGHYEGVDERVRKNLVDYEVSIGDYILTGGELPAMVLVDSIVRLVPGALGDKNSSKEESFSKWLLEYPQYTRPSNFKEMKVPEVLLSGNHQKIRAWRQKQSIKITKTRRPDLWRRHEQN